MDIKGLDYNTQREPLVLPEYGREIQKMIDLALQLPTKAERQRCAETIVKIMATKSPQPKDSKGYKRRFWDHLAIMSNFQLDIDYPYDITNAIKIATKPNKVPYQHNRIKVRHYGKMLCEMFENLKTMPEGRARTMLIKATANQMKRDLYQWGHGAVENEKIADDLYQLTDGAVELDLKKFRFEKINPNDFVEKKKKKR